MTSIALSSKWWPERYSVSSSSGASLRFGWFIDCSFKGSGRQSLDLNLPLPPTS